MRILVVEDHAPMAQILRQGLIEEDYLVETASDGLSGLAKAQSGDFDVVLLDVNLPDIDGFEFMKRLRKTRSDIPVMVVSARDEVSDRVEGLDAGADDYMVKPFSFDELIARIRVLLRRPAEQRQVRLVYGDIEMDLFEGRVRRADKLLWLSAREFALLRAFLENPEQVVSREWLIESVWRTKAYNASNKLEVYINYLRNKLESPDSPRVIHTVRWKGYVLSHEALV